MRAGHRRKPDGLDVAAPLSGAMTASDFWLLIGGGISLAVTATRKD